MTATMRLPGSVAEVDASPGGPTVGAFFDLDGTLIAGYSARYLTEDRIKRREIGASEFLRTFAFAVGAGLGQASFDDVLRLGAQAWRGRADEDLQEMAIRLFEQKVSDSIYPEMRDLVHAHQRRGHTVALVSSATSYQVEPVADYLGIGTVICNRFALADGVLTGEVEQPVIWGSGKAEAVQKLAGDRGIDLASSYFYADGDEDLALMYLVGHPRPTNPGKQLRAIASKRGWPVLAFTSRGSSVMAGRLRTLAGTGAAVPLAGLGVGVGLARRNKRDGINFAFEHWFSVLLAINGVKLNVVGRENAWSQRPAVFIFNHRNNFDAFIAGSIVRRDFTGVGKKELERNWFMRTSGRLLDVAFIDRNDLASSIAALHEIEELARKGLSIVIAPEGTRLDTQEVGPFKKGPFRMAMAAGIPIVPIVIRNAEIIGGRNATRMNPGTVDVAVLAPVSTTGWELDDLPQHIASVRQSYLDTLADWPT